MTTAWDLASTLAAGTPSVVVRGEALEQGFFEHGEPTLRQLVHVGSVVDAEHLLDAPALGHEDVRIGQEPAPDDLLADEPEFSHGEDVRADVREIRVRMDDGGRRHAGYSKGARVASAGP